MNIFFDTSSLVKFFNVEQGTDQVTELILSRSNQSRPVPLAVAGIGQRSLPPLLHPHLLRPDRGAGYRKLFRRKVAVPGQ